MRTNALRIVLLLTLLLAWEIAATDPKLSFAFGKPSLIFESLFYDTLSGALPWNALITAYEALFGFILGTAIGTILGFSCWLFPRFSALTRPYILAVGAIPVFAFAPIVIVWFGIGIKMKIAVAFVGVFLTALDQSYRGAMDVDDYELNYFRAVGARRSEVLRLIVIPRSLTWVLGSMRLNISVALLGAFVGEFISSEAGLGHFMVRSGALYDIPGVFSGAIYLTGLATLSHYVLGIIEARKLEIAAIVSVPGILRRQRRSVGGSLSPRN